LILATNKVSPTILLIIKTKGISTNIPIEILGSGSIAHPISNQSTINYNLS
jgi:hypothetical protein